MPTCRREKPELPPFIFTAFLCPSPETLHCRLLFNCLE